MTRARIPPELRTAARVARDGLLTRAGILSQPGQGA
jgi:hypothetical protein